MARKRSTFISTPVEDKNLITSASVRRYDQVRLVGPGRNEVITCKQAFNEAQGQSLDLVVVDLNAKPVVVKIMDHNKFRYEQNKRAKKAVNKSPELKTVRISMNIADNDLLVKAGRAQGFLLKGHPVKVELRMKGRENSYGDRALARMQDFRLLMSEVRELRVERPPQRFGKRFEAVYLPV